MLVFEKSKTQTLLCNFSQDWNEKLQSTWTHMKKIYLEWWYPMSKIANLLGFEKWSSITMPVIWLEETSKCDNLVSSPKLFGRVPLIYSLQVPKFIRFCNDPKETRIGPSNRFCARLRPARFSCWTIQFQSGILSCSSL